jgi:hypothetical protein
MLAKYILSVEIKLTPINYNLRFFRYVKKRHIGSQYLYQKLKNYIFNNQIIII